MELSIRDWMVVIGVLLLLVVGLDGYRRSQKERKNRVRISKTAKRRARKGGPQQDPNFVAEMDEDVEAARLGNSDLGISRKEIVEPVAAFTASDEIDESSGAMGQETAMVNENYAVDPLFENPFEVDERRLPNVNVQEPVVVAEPKPEFESEIDSQGHEGEFQHSLVFGREQTGDAAEPDEILVLNVLATDAQGFSGEDLLHILRACDCRIGDMNIFHRYESEGAKGAVQFSIVNMVEPGIFNLDDIRSFSTPGVSFFLRLPGPQNPTEAYNCMVEVAQCLVRNLGGELKDDMVSAVTEQTLSHDRQRIRDYQQRQLLTD